jgi:hypothetical protein
VSALGFEPRTNGLKGHCSAVELRALENGMNFTTPGVESQRIVFLLPIPYDTQQNCILMLLIFLPVHDKLKA